MKLKFKKQEKVRTSKLRCKLVTEVNFIKELLERKKQFSKIDLIL